MRGATRSDYHMSSMLVFQSTHPMRGATSQRLMPALAPLFQSTHPMRGATMPDGDYIQAVRISIHAPHEGCDGVSGPKLNP